MKIVVFEFNLVEICSQWSNQQCIKNNNFSYNKIKNGQQNGGDFVSASLC